MRRLGAHWERFWFAPQPTSTLALVRIAVGSIAFGWGLSLAPDLFDLYSSTGVVGDSAAARGPGSWDLLGTFHSDTALLCVYAALLLGSIALAVGLRTRLAAVVVFVAMLAFARRNPFALNDGDALLRLLVLYLALAPAGASLSLDRLRSARDAFWEFPARAPWALRLIQLQLSAVYLSTLIQRAQGEYWTSGTAVSYALRLEELQRFAVPAPLHESMTLAGVATFGTLTIELALALLVWNRKARPWVLWLGVALHLGIDYSLRVGFFSLAVLAALISFVAPQTAQAWICAARGHFGGYRPTGGREETCPSSCRATPCAIDGARSTRSGAVDPAQRGNRLR